MSDEFTNWTGDDDYPGDDAETADLGGLPADDPLPVAGFGPADEVAGFGAADEPAGDDSGLDEGEHLGGGTGAALDYGDDLSWPDGPDGADGADDPADSGTDDVAEDGFGAAPPADQGFGAADPLPGVDPDTPAGADEWPAAVFPPQLDTAGVPTPVDGWPWADADLLGGDASAESPPPGDPPQPGSVDPGELAGYAAVDATAADLWATLLGSDDPATSTLARFWSPR
ncbi:hypothetical protein [Micromonospora sp. NBC_01813]|uniref:hypothetical protein n=1 Tax=Micromonospora sp. NBC_01813 TaxID=2975988 RepID=UPI002DD8F296|nr:hypothetical protein [Micromonospora sp. NBC_01813]WSA10473.1 hypothetical protein OG958_06710 [Micromonospora sp. NBC_01813]